MTARALSGPYRIDRETPPRAFYTLKASTGRFQAGVHVFAQSNDNSDRTQITLGVVSAQTPFGQGTEYHFSRRQLRRATPDEVRAALQQNHATKTGAWRPECPEVRDLKVLLSGGVSTDAELTALVRRSKAEGRRALVSLTAQYEAIERRWRTISQAQAAAVLAKLK